MKSFHDYSMFVTNDTYLENLQHGNAEYPFAYYLEDIWQFDFYCIDWHRHPEIEIIYVEKGTVFCYVGADKQEKVTIFNSRNNKLHLTDGLEIWRR